MGRVDPTKIIPAKPQPSIGERIEVAAWLGLRGKLGARTEPLYCLNFARTVVEYALGLKPRGFYSLVTGVDSDPCAQELEELLTRQRRGWLVPSHLSGPLAPGDLLFWPFKSPDGKDWGHVGVAVRHKGEWWVAQNTISKRGIGYLGALRLIKLSDHPVPRTVIRIGKTDEVAI